MKLYKFYYNEHAYISIPVAWMKARPMVKGQNTVYKIYRSLAYSMIILITVQVKLWFFSQICRTEFTFVIVMCHQNNKYENSGYSEWSDGGKTLVYKWIKYFYSHTYFEIHAWNWFLLSIPRFSYVRCLHTNICVFQWQLILIVN